MYRAVVAFLVVMAAGPAFAGVAVADSGTAQLGDEVDCEFPVSVEDATGQMVTVDEEPESVVVTAPSAAQHMWDIGARDKVVGAPHEPATAYLDGIENTTDVTDNFEPNQEVIVDLEPDLVIVPNVNDEALVENLRDAGLTVYYYPLVQNLDEMYELVETSGQLVGEFDTAAQVTANVSGQVNAIQEATADEDNPRVFYEFFEFTAGPDTLEGDIIERAGGDNIAPEGDRPYYQLSEEIIAEQDPEWLVLQEGNPMPESEAVQNSTAVQQDQIVRVDPNLISQHGPRNIIPLVELAYAFHPEVMEELDLGAVEPADASQCAVVDTADDADDEMMDDDTMEDDDTPADADDDGVGFTAGAALVAVLTVAVLARRAE